MIPKFIEKFQIPHKPGIYMYKNQAGKVIYVGKAIDLYNRVSAYFSGPHDLKTSRLVENIRGVETIIVESELEALILEANLIKKYYPLFNISLKDDKDYLYIAVTREDFPKVITARKRDLKPVKNYFGPFPSAKTVKSTLKQLRRVFPWCSNPPGPRNKTHRPCFYYHIGLCPGACVGTITKEDCGLIINRFVKFMSGKQQELIAELRSEMKSYSDFQEFEKANRVKKVIEGINYLLQPNRVSSYLENPNFLQDERRRGLEELKKVFNLKDLPERIEGYDISNISGTNATGSMVVLTDGEIDKSQYRKFKIRITGKPNDYAMHSEMMGRRLKNEWQLPQLMIIDGGRGQVRAAYKKLQEAGINIPIYGIAKRMEWLYPPEGEAIKLPMRSLALRLLQKLRDESHRFAINYHKQLRAREFLEKT